MSLVRMTDMEIVLFVIATRAKYAIVVFDLIP